MDVTGRERLWKSRQGKASVATANVAVGDPPHGRQRVYTVLRFSLVAVHEGQQVNLFPLEDALVAAKSGQKPPFKKGWWSRPAVSARRSGAFVQRK